DGTEEQSCGCNCSGQEHHSVSAHELLQPVQTAGWTRENSFLLQVTLYVHCQSVGCRITARAVLLQALKHNPIQITAKLRQQPGRFDVSLPGGLGQFLVSECFDFRRRTERLPLTNGASQLLHTEFQQIRG